MTEQKAASGELLYRILAEMERPIYTVGSRTYVSSAPNDGNLIAEFVQGIANLRMHGARGQYEAYCSEAWFTDFEAQGGIAPHPALAGPPSCPLPAGEQFKGYFMSVPIYVKDGHVGMTVMCVSHAFRRKGTTGNLSTRDTGFQPPAKPSRHACTCPRDLVLHQGCKCGGV